MSDTDDPATSDVEGGATSELDRIPPTHDDVEAAASRLSGVAHRTPVLTSRDLDAAAGAHLFLKAEHLQRVGAFKFRGAFNALARLTPAQRSRGVVSFSSGNHAQAVACAARELAMPATIVMPLDAPEVKLAATRGYGATVVTYDRYREDRRAIATDLAREHGALLLPPYDHPDIVAGQGTVALELLAQVPELDVIVAPIGGGGLLAGCALAADDHPGVRTVGVEPAERRAARDALATGEVVTVPVPQTALDGQQTPDIGQLPLAVLRERQIEVVGVEDDAVLDTVRTLAVRTKQVVEPSGASALAAVLRGYLEVQGLRVGVVLSGGNVAQDRLAEILTAGDPLTW